MKLKSYSLANIVIGFIIYGNYSVIAMWPGWNRGRWACNGKVGEHIAFDTVCSAAFPTAPVSADRLSRHFENIRL